MCRTCVQNHVQNRTFSESKIKTDSMRKSCHSLPLLVFFFFGGGGCCSSQYLKKWQLPNVQQKSQQYHRRQLIAIKELFLCLPSKGPLKTYYCLIYFKVLKPYCNYKLLLSYKKEVNLWYLTQTHSTIGHYSLSQS